MLREIDGVAVGVEDAVLCFAVGRAFVDPGGGVEIFARFAYSGYVFDFEAEVVYSRLQLRPFPSSSGPANLILVFARPSVFPKQDRYRLFSLDSKCGASFHVSEILETKFEVLKFEEVHVRLDRREELAGSLAPHFLGRLRLLRASLLQVFVKKISHPALVIGS